MVIKVLQTKFEISMTTPKKEAENYISSGASTRMFEHLVKALAFYENDSTFKTLGNVIELDSYKGAKQIRKILELS